MKAGTMLLFENPYDQQSGEVFDQQVKSWSQAWKDAASATSRVQQVGDNLNARRVSLREAYDNRITAIHEATGVQLVNPTILQNEDRTRFERDPDFLTKTKPEEFEAELKELAKKFPDQADIILGSGSIKSDAFAITRQADADLKEALGGVELGLFGRLSSALAGGFHGAFHDPAQIAATIAGGGAGTGKTIAARIGSVFLREAAINAGVEAGIQIVASQHRRDAGLEYGVGDFAENVGIAAIFGGTFGGLFQGGGEVARLFRGQGLSKNLSPDGIRAAERVSGGEPLRGDVERVADELGIELSDKVRRDLDQAFELDDLDRAVDLEVRRHLPDELDPVDLDVVTDSISLAATRHLDDPDRYPSPEVVEEYLMAEIEAGRVPASTTVDQFIARQGDIQPIRSSPSDDPLDGQTLRPEVNRGADDIDTPDAALVFDNPRHSAAARRDAALRAGDFEQAVLDQDGNITNTNALIPIDEGDGNVRLVAADEAIAFADEPNAFAELLDACQI